MTRNRNEAQRAAEKWVRDNHTWLLLAEVSFRDAEHIFYTGYLEGSIATYDNALRKLGAKSNATG